MKAHFFTSSFDTIEDDFGWYETNIIPQLNTEVVIQEQQYTVTSIQYNYDKDYIEIYIEKYKNNIS
jgi:hypothetical protein